MRYFIFALLLCPPVLHALDQPLTLEKIKDLVNSANTDSNTANDIRTVDQLLQALPAGFRKNPLFMIHSRSLQSATLDQPRVILKGYGSTFLMTFNTKPTSSGYKTVEMIQWDDGGKKFLFGELVFASADHETNPAGAVKIHFDQSSPEIRKCAACHTNSMRPNWDTYNFWAGLVPFNRDLLLKDHKETPIYKNIVSKVTGGELRLRHLILPKPIADGTAFNMSSYDIPHYIDDNNTTAGEGPSVDLFDELTDLNHQRIAKQLASHPSFEKIKYAALGAALSCKIEGFLPPQYQAAAQQFFGTDYAGVVKATQVLQDSLYADKQNRHKAILGITALGTVNNREASQPMVSSLRWILEPFGVPTKEWSLSIDPGTYTFADLFGGFAYALMSYIPNASCADLEKKSQEALSQ
jgi:hypothetical protein